MEGFFCPSLKARRILPFTCLVKVHKDQSPAEETCGFWSFLRHGLGYLLGSTAGQQPAVQHHSDGDGAWPETLPASLAIVRGNTAGKAENSSQRAEQLNSITQLLTSEVV